MVNSFTEALAEQRRRERAALLAEVFAQEGMEGLKKRGLLAPTFAEAEVPLGTGLKRAARGVPAIVGGAFTQEGARGFGDIVLGEGRTTPSVRIPEPVRRGADITLRSFLAPFTIPGQLMPGRKAPLLTPRQLGVRGAVEAAAPVPLGGPVATVGGRVVGAGVRAAAPGMRAAARAAGPAVGRLARAEGGFLRTPGPGGRADPRFSTLLNIEEDIQKAEAAVKASRGQRRITAQGNLDALKTLRAYTLEGELPPAEWRKYQELSQQLEEDTAALQEMASIKPVAAPKFGTPERAAWAAARRERGVAPGATGRRRTALKARVEATQREMADIEAGRTLPEATPETIRAAGLEAQASPPGPAIQAGMGIGERPAQGGLFENLRGEAQALPLADAENLAARAARRAEIARGQGALPLTPATVPVPAKAAKQPWQMTREEFSLQPIWEPPPIGEGLQGRVPAALHWHAMKKALREGKPIPPEVLADYPDLVKVTKPLPKAVKSHYTVSEGYSTTAGGKPVTRWDVLTDGQPSGRTFKTKAEAEAAVKRFEQAAANIIAQHAEAARPGVQPPIDVFGNQGDRAVLFPVMKKVLPEYKYNELANKSNLTYDEVFQLKDSIRGLGKTVSKERQRALDLLEAVAPTERQTKRLTTEQIIDVRTTYKTTPSAVAPAPSLPKPGIRRATKVAKEPWEMTYKEYSDSLSQGVVGGETAKHIRLIRQALKERKPVPPEVIANYPDGTFAAVKPTKAAQAVKAPTPAAGQVLPPPAPAVPQTAAGGAPPIQPPTPPVAQAVPPPKGPRRPDFRAGARAVPGLGGPPPTGISPPGRPPVVSPSAGQFPSGRVPGGAGRQTVTAPVDNYQLLQESLAKPPTPFRERVTAVRESFLRQFYSDQYPLQDLAARTGTPADKLAQVVHGATAAGEDIIRTSYRPVTQRLGKDTKFLEEYMVLKRADDILALHPHAQLPGGMQSFGGIQQAMRTLEGKLGTKRLQAVQEAAEELWRLNDVYVLQPMRDEGIVSPDLYRELRADHPHYIPFQRADFADIFHSVFTTPEASVSSQSIRKMAAEGSTRRLDNPLARMEAQVIKIQAVIFRNRAGKGIAQAVEQLANDTGDDVIHFIEPKRALRQQVRVTGQQIPIKKKAEHSQLWETVSYFDGGVKHTVEIPAVWGRVAKSLDQEPRNFFNVLFKAIVSPVRYGAIIWNPTYTPVGVMRDAFAALFREKLVPLSPDYIAGWAAVIKKNDTFHEAARSGALMSGIVDTMRATEALGRARRLGAISVSNPLDAVLVLPRLVERMNVIAEQAPRVAVYRKLRMEGLSELEAAVRARDATVDFSKAGTTMKVINQIVPFSNAAVQGSANVLRTVKSNPKWALLMGAAFVAPTILSRVNNMRFETSELIPDYEYTRNWVIQVGEFTKKDGAKAPIYIKIPKGEIASIFTFPAEALFNLARQQEDRSAVELLLASAGQAAAVVSPVDPSISGLLPGVVGTATALSTGQDLFTGAPIVPRREEGLPAEQQFGEDTSKVAIALGQGFKISPRLLDFTIKDYTAGGGTTGLWLTDMALEAAGYRPETFGALRAESQAEQRTTIEQASRAPALSRFLGTRATQQERRGWEQFDQAVEATNRQFNALPAMNALGIRLGSVGDSFDLRPGVKGGSVSLTPQERAEYQRLMATTVIGGLRDYRVTGSNEQKRDKIVARMQTLKGAARGSFRGGLIARRQAKPSTPTPSVNSTNNNWLRQLEAAKQQREAAGVR